MAGCDEFLWAVAGVVLLHEIGTSSWHAGRRGLSIELVQLPVDLWIVRQYHMRNLEERFAHDREKLARALAGVRIERQFLMSFDASLKVGLGCTECQ